MTSWKPLCVISILCFVSILFVMNDVKNRSQLSAITERGLRKVLSHVISEIHKNGTKIDADSLIKSSRISSRISSRMKKIKFM